MTKGEKIVGVALLCALALSAVLSWANPRAGHYIVAGTADHIFDFGTQPPSEVTVIFNSRPGTLSFYNVAGVRQAPSLEYVASGVSDTTFYCLAGVAYDFNLTGYGIRWGYATRSDTTGITLYWR